MGTLTDFSQRHGLRFWRTAALDQPNGESRWRGGLCSQDGKERYAYWEVWERALPRVLWVMLNPGTGEIERRRRRTLERCIVWSKKWGYGGLLIANVSPVRAKSAKHLEALRPCFSPLNVQAITVLRDMVDDTIVAWGTHGASYAAPCLHVLDGAKCLAVTSKGEPAHPLYLPGASGPVPWQPVFARARSRSA